jgi:hypothetical protein
MLKKSSPSPFMKMISRNPLPASYPTEDRGSIGTVVGRIAGARQQHQNIGATVVFSFSPHQAYRMVLYGTSPTSSSTTIGIILTHQQAQASPTYNTTITKPYSNDVNADRIAIDTAIETFDNTATGFNKAARTSLTFQP